MIRIASRNWLATILVMTLLCFGCESGMQYETIVGRWQAYEVTEEGESLDIDPSAIKLHFHSNLTYEYSSTLNYREAGPCRLEDRYLYTSDTLVSPPQDERVVMIINDPVDSLVIRMEEEEKERVLRLVRIGD